MNDKELKKLRYKMYVLGIQIKDIAASLKGNNYKGQMSAVNVSNVLRGFYKNPIIIEKVKEEILKREHPRKALSLSKP